MNMELVSLINACRTFHEAERENSKKFFLFRFKASKEIEKNRKLLEEKIKEMLNDEWTVEYLCSLENTILSFYDIFDYGENDYFSIPSYNKNNDDPIDQFYPIYFNDKKDDKERIIILEIISENINFRIFDSNTGNSFAVTSKFTVQPSQKKIETICKNLIVNSLIKYLNGKDKNNDSNLPQMKKFKR